MYQPEAVIDQYQNESEKIQEQSVSLGEMGRLEAAQATLRVV